MAGTGTVRRVPSRRAIRIGYAVAGGFFAWRWASAGHGPAWQHAVQVLVMMAVLTAAVQLVRWRRRRGAGRPEAFRLPLRELLLGKALLVAAALGAEYLLARWTAHAQLVVGAGLFAAIALGGPALHSRHDERRLRLTSLKRPSEESMADTTDNQPDPSAVLPGLPRQRRCPLDPAPEFAQLRREAPVSRIAFPGGGSGWLVSRYEDVRAMLADPRFSSRLGTAAPQVRPAPAMLSEEPPPGALLRLDAPEHARYRRPVMRAFTVKRVAALRPRIQEIVDERLDAMEKAGGPVDLVERLALPVTSLVICELLGVSYDDRDTFQGLAARILSIDTSPEQGQQARLALGSFMAQLVEAKRRDPGDDLLSTLVAEADADPETPLTDVALSVLGSLLLIAGHETTANMIALGTLTLLHHPDQLAALRENPALADRAVEELLRYLTIIQFGLTRVATEDLTFAGRPIRAGEYVVASLPSANRDPGLGIDEPDRLDITRDPAAHVAFGYGPHQCLGQQLARAELQITLTSLFTRFPGLRLAVAAEELPFRDDMVIYGLHALPVTW